MKPVFQTIFGKSDGNCFQACIASILEMELEDVPHFCKGDNPEWMYDLNEWLHQFGLGALTVAFQDEAPIKHGYCCAGGPGGPEGLKHSVVLKDFKMVHNPHEGWGELDGEPQDYTFIIVLDPEKHLSIRRDEVESGGETSIEKILKKHKVYMADLELDLLRHFDRLRLELLKYQMSTRKE